VDFLIESDELLSVVPIEVKSGKNYKIHSALDNFVTTKEYQVKEAIVLSNERDVTVQQGVTYLPIYYVMYL
jgi:hypothetical protein